MLLLLARTTAITGEARLARNAERPTEHDNIVLKEHTILDYSDPFIYSAGKRVLKNTSLDLKSPNLLPGSERVFVDAGSATGAGTRPRDIFFEPFNGLRLMAGLDSVIERANKGRALALLQAARSRPDLCEVLSRSFT